MLQRLRDGEVRERIRGDILRDGLNNFGRVESWHAVRIAISPETPELAGQTVGQVAESRGIDQLDAACDILLADKGHTRIVVTSMAEEGVQEILRSPMVLVGSDGNSLAPLRHHRPGQTAPPLLRHFRPGPRPLRPRPGLAAPAHRRPQDDRRVGGGPEIGGPGHPGRGQLGRRHGLRPAYRSGGSDLRRSPPVRHGHLDGGGEWAGGHRRSGAHQGSTREGAAQRSHRRWLALRQPPSDGLRETASLLVR